MSKEHPEIRYFTPSSCPTGKRLYPSRKDAKAATRKLGTKGGSTRLDAYRCRDGCDGYHIGHHQRRPGA